MAGAKKVFKAVVRRWRGSQKGSQYTRYFKSEAEKTTYLRRQQQFETVKHELRGPTDIPPKTGLPKQARYNGMEFSDADYSKAVTRIKRLRGKTEEQQKAIIKQIKTPEQAKAMETVLEDGGWGDLAGVARIQGYLLMK